MGGDPDGRARREGEGQGETPSALSPKGEASQPFRTASADPPATPPPKAAIPKPGAAPSTRAVKPPTGGLPPVPKPGAALRPASASEAPTSSAPAAERPSERPNEHSTVRPAARPGSLLGARPLPGKPKTPRPPSPNKPTPATPARRPKAPAKATEAKAGDPKTAEAKTAEAKTAEAKTAEAKTAEAKTAGTKTAGTKTEAKTAEAKTAEAKTAEAKTTGTKTAGTKASTKAPAAASPAASPSERPRPAGTLPPPPAESAASDGAGADEPSAPPPLPATPRARREADVTAAQRLAERESTPGPTVQPEPIAQFGRFGILGRLATGGMADIFLGRDSLEGEASRHVIIKVVRGEFSEDSDFARMFLNEGRLAMRLSHPNLCSIYECGRHAGRFFMAMEYVNGQTLREVLVRATQRKQAMPIPVLLKVFSLVAEALDFAHRAKDSQGRPLKIVHRDVSPHNVMLSFDGVVKLLDFGVAKAERSGHATEAGALKGKFSYMSPEQALSEPLDHRADIFSLGVCIFESVTGRRLFHRKAQYDTLKAILEQDPPPLDAFRDDVPEGLQEILERALAKRPDDRYQRASELQHDLEKLLAETRQVVGTALIGELMAGLFEDEIIRGPVLETGNDVRERFDSLTATAEQSAVTPGPARPSRTPYWIGGAVALSLLGAGVAFLTSGNAPPAAPADPTVESAPRTREVEPPPAPDPAPTEEATPVAVPSPEGEQDGTLPAALDTSEGAADPAAVTGEDDDDGAQEAPSTSSSQRRPANEPPGSRRGRRGGTVIVTDPGF